MVKACSVLLAALVGVGVVGVATGTADAATTPSHQVTTACVTPAGASYTTPDSTNSTAYALADQTGHLVLSAGVQSTDSDGFPTTAATSKLTIKAKATSAGATVTVVISPGIRDLYRYFQISKAGVGGQFGAGTLSTSSAGTRTVSFSVPKGYHLDSLVVSGFDPDAPVSSDHAAAQVTSPVVVSPTGDNNETTGPWNNYSEVTTDANGHLVTYAARIAPGVDGATTDVGTQRIVVKATQPAGACGSKVATVQIWLGKGVTTVLNGYRYSRADGTGKFGRGTVAKTSAGLTRITYTIPAGYYLERIDAYGNDAKQPQVDN